MSDGKGRAAIDASGQIPVLDLADYRAGQEGARERLAAELVSASEKVGFYFLSNHGVPQPLIDEAFAQAARFHALPLDIKMPLRMDHHMTGYLPMGDSEVSTLDGQEQRDRPKADLNASLFVRRDRTADDPDVVSGKLWRAMNRWPADLPGFREGIMEYWRTMEGLAQSLLPVFETALETTPGYISSKFEGAHINLRLSHYPPVKGPVVNQYGIAPHTDAGFLTFLPQTGTPGLEIRTRSNEWLPVPPMPGTFLVNTGDILHRWTNGRFLSTVHRASNPFPDRDRYAIPFFYDPNTDATIECFASCTSPDNPPKYPPTTYGEYYAWFIGRNYRHQRKGAA